MPNCRDEINRLGVPHAALAVAALRIPVWSPSSVAGQPAKLVTLGRALIAEARQGGGASWMGALDARNKYSTKRLMKNKV
jgi:hypothetical protein